MFTTVNEEVAGLEKLWIEEEDIDVLRARLTIRLEEGSKRATVRVDRASMGAIFEKSRRSSRG